MKPARRPFLIAVLATEIAGAMYLLNQLWHSGLVHVGANGGVGGALMYALVYLGTALLMLPTGVGNAGAGLLFGVARGMLLVYPALILAGMLSFGISRSLARDWVAQRIANRPKFLAVDNAIARGGFKMVLLLRMSPVSPFGFLSYSLGLTRVRLRDYFFGTLLGAVPGTALYVYAGSALKDLGGLAVRGADPAGVMQRLTFWIGLLLTIFVVIMITRYARQELKRALLAPAEAAGD